MKKIKFKKSMRDPKTNKDFEEETEGYLYETGGLQFGLNKDKFGFWHETEITTGRSVRGDCFKKLAEVKAECDRCAPIAKRVLPNYSKISQNIKSKQEDKPMKTNQNKKTTKPLEMAKSKRPNPFSGADDTYLTKNKIAVTRTKHTSMKRGHKSLTQTNYYEQNDSNMRLLAKVTDTVRIGRKGNKGFKRLR